MLSTTTTRTSAATVLFSSSVRSRVTTKSAISVSRQKNQGHLSAKVAIQENSKLISFYPVETRQPSAMSVRLVSLLTSKIKKNVKSAPRDTLLLSTFRQTTQSGLIAATDVLEASLVS